MKSKLFNLFGLLMIGLAAANITACKDTDVDEGKDDGTPRVMSVKIGSHEGNTISSCLIAPMDTTIMLNAQLNKGSSKNLVIKFGVSLDMVAEYNEANGTSYSMLPASAYEFTNRQSILPRYNTESSSVEIRLLSGKLTDTDVYLLPVTVSEIEGSDEIELDANDKAAYILFSKADVPELRFIELTDITLTTEIGAGKHNWFSAYLEPHVFDVATAAQNSDMMDFVLMQHSADDVRFYGPQMGVNDYGDAYTNRMAPYTAGFRYLPFTGLGNKVHTRAEYDGLSSYEDLLALIDHYAKLPTGAYKYVTNLDRMQSFANLQKNVNSAVISTWGAMLNGKGFAMYLITDAQKTGDYYTVKFNVKFFEQNFRTEYNSLAMKTQDIEEPTSWEASMRIDGSDVGSVTKSLMPAEEASVKFSVKLDNPAPAALTVKFKADESLVAAYNTANGTSYAMVPAAAYEFTTTTATVAKSATESGQAEVKLLVDNLTDFETYLLPVSVESVTGNNNVTVNAGKNAGYILFSKVDTKPKFIELKNITLTTEIGEGKLNWFAAYKAPHVFDVTSAAQFDEMMDFALVKVDEAATHFYGAQMGQHYGGVYATRMNPLTVGFQKLTFTGLGNKVHTQAEYDAISSYEDLVTLVTAYHDSGSYKYLTAVDRMQSFKLAVNSAVVCLWGKKLAPEGFAIIIVRDIIQNAGSYHTVTFDIKYSEFDYRTEYNDMGILDKL